MTSLREQEVATTTDSQPDSGSFSGPAIGGVPLDAILKTDELQHRPQRPPDYEAESRAFGKLTEALSKSPRTILQTLADTALDILGADSAGISLLTDDRSAFYWAAIAGAWKPHLGGGTPRNFGPCGDVLDHKRPLLFSHWERRYPYLSEALPLAEEGLLVPFSIDGEQVGTIWVIAHSDRRKFDAEDLRQLESMGRFASAGYRTTKLIESEESGRAALESTERLRESEHRLDQLLQALPAAIYTTDKDGRITYFNEAAVEFAGRRPEIGDMWCVTWRLFYPDGTRMPHEECPMAVALKENRPVYGEEAIAERPDGTRRWFAPYPTPLRNSAGELVGAVNMLVDITERKEAEARQKLLLNELNHRVKNTLASVQSLVVQSAKTAGNVEEFRNSVEGRILAMSKAHDQLSRHSWAEAELGELLRACLEPYLSKGNLKVHGDPVVIPPRAALMCCMAVHELATNAAKYGALSTQSGRVDLGWTVTEEGGRRLVRLNWREQGGPPVIPPARKGFGTRLLERGIQAELQGTTEMKFLPAGLECEIKLPLIDADD